MEHIHVVVGGGNTIKWLIDALGVRTDAWSATPMFALDKHPRRMVYDPMIAPFCRRRRRIKENILFQTKRRTLYLSIVQSAPV